MRGMRGVRRRDGESDTSVLVCRCYESVRIAFIVAR